MSAPARRAVWLGRASLLGALLGLWVAGVLRRVPEVPPGQVPGPGLPQLASALDLVGLGLAGLAIVLGGAALKGDAWLGFLGATLAGAVLFYTSFS